MCRLIEGGFFIDVATTNLIHPQVFMLYELGTDKDRGCDTEGSKAMAKGGHVFVFGQVVNELGVGFL
jgi:hypothetical protein